MAEKLFRWNGTQWVPVTDVTRIEVQNASVSNSIEIIRDVKFKNPPSRKAVTVEPSIVVFGGVV